MQNKTNLLFGMLSFKFEVQNLFTSISLFWMLKSIGNVVGGC